MATDFEQLATQYRADIVARGYSIDPENREDWASMALGYALGKGYSVEDALKFSGVAHKYQGA